MKNNIICGFAGIGKSYLAKHEAGYIDLESTPFKKNWDLYIDVAEHMQSQGYKVMMSCHKELRDKLKERNVDYIVVIPTVDYKDNYIQRYKDRGSTREFIELFEDKFEEFIREILDNEHDVYLLGKEYETLSDIIDLLNKLPITPKGK
jgi:hypothetical protein